jgi:hypothetical protein
MRELKKSKDEAVLSEPPQTVNDSRDTINFHDSEAVFNIRDRTIMKRSEKFNKEIIPDELAKTIDFLNSTIAQKDPDINIVYAEDQVKESAFIRRREERAAKKKAESLAKQAEIAAKLAQELKDANEQRAEEELAKYLQEWKDEDERLDAETAIEKQKAAEEAEGAIEFAAKLIQENEDAAQAKAEAEQQVIAVAKQAQEQKAADDARQAEAAAKLAQEHASAKQSKLEQEYKDAENARQTEILARRQKKQQAVAIAVGVDIVAAAAQRTQEQQATAVAKPEQQQVIAAAQSARITRPSLGKYTQNENARKTSFCERHCVIS